MEPGDVEGGKKERGTVVHAQRRASRRTEATQGPTWTEREELLAGGGTRAADSVDRAEARRKRGGAEERTRARHARGPPKACRLTQGTT